MESCGQCFTFASHAALAADSAVAAFMVTATAGITGRWTAGPLMTRAFAELNVRARAATAVYSMAKCRKIAMAFVEVKARREPRSRR